ncbi:MAG: preprotein translocase subunit SecA [Chloroflexi bacterium 13_1_40CM_3_65_12]|nr:MAG: preprotein translocase subunit SecA [Chloroflexi bacterium 13_1_40CM_65_17]OLC66345.1 MAG: preprotein translocase subunit SecA [Actinobacteria bacterium 13_1_40CM_4_65_12]OLD26743.1 MAG: preprotein translocase subunit SecA [Chloroflexi bacterium 13_1_40CM_3_65_12]
MLNLTKLLDPNEREVKRHLAVAAAVNELEPELKALDDAGLRQRSDELRQRARDGHDLDELLIEAFAVCREASRRTIGLRHFDVQLVGGIVLHQGKIAEMKTGEGKTLVASLALYLNALAGEGVHLVTVNDYLARRDAGWMGPIYHLLGMSVGVNVGTSGTFIYDPEFLDETHPDSRLQHLRPATKKEAYRADITYATNSELAFDYLRDNMALDLNQCSQRKLHYAIVDEVDSILIDEARTPHIISGQSEESTEKYYEYARWAGRLVENEDYEVDLKHKSASLTEQGIAKMERWTSIRNIYDLENVIEAHQINQALKAKSLFLRDRDYLVKDGEVIIVDEFTGRTMPGRRWSDGLHQAVEAKEGVKVQQEQKTIATITVQNYFRQYEKLAGMTGTALTEAEEFHKIYGLDVVAIPTHRNMVREDSPDVIYKSEKSKFEAVIEEIVEMNKQRRPVLVGTVSVEKSERLSKMLERKGVKHNVLNAKQHEREAAIVAEAGQPSAVTIATNMAGRGTDIVLGTGVTDVGGLHIIGTERHESRRIDNQLRGRAGRQGDPGSSRFFISLEDDLMKIFGPAADRIGRLMDSLEVEPIEHPWVARSIAGAQKKVEGMHFDARKHVVEYDDVMNKQRQIVYEERRKVLEGADARGNILEYVREIVDKAIEVHCESRHPENWDMEGLVKYLSAYLPIAPGSQIPDEVIERGRVALAEHLNAAAADAYDKKVEEIGPELMPLVEKDVMLRTIDWQWMEYLTQMEHFREGVGLRAYGQRDPLVEYKNEALEMFNELRDRIQGSIVARIFRVQVQRNAAPPPPSPMVREVLESGPGDPDGSGKPGRNGAPRQRRAAPVGAAAAIGGEAAAAKLGRNDPCWCGSGKKYKRCHGR